MTLSNVLSLVVALAAGGAAGGAAAAGGAGPAGGPAAATGPAAAGPAWTRVAETEGITVLSRPRAGSQVGEVQATGLIDAPPHAVWETIRDYEHYTRDMPYTKEGKVLSKVDGGRIIHFYSVVNAPFVSERDYVIEVLDESRWDGGKGYLKMSWKPLPDAVPKREGIVRVTQNEGSWVLEPRDGGTRTFATYWLFSDPGGSLPKFVVNHANSTAVPDVFRAVRKLSKARAAAAAR